MSLHRSGLLAKILYRPYVQKISLRYNTSSGEDDANVPGAPYRPFPTEGYQYPKTQEYWAKNGYKSMSEKVDEYPKEELYLDEIEERLRKYDKKYSKPDEVSSLLNEYGLENQDDKAYHVYGGGLSSTQDEIEKYGRGNKIDPSLYINGDYAIIGRKAIPPLQYLTKEQIRRSRGSLASFRETPPETESVFKIWNGYTCLGVAIGFLAAKEFIVLGHHDMFDAVLLWSFFGFLGSISGDFFAWFHTISFQEMYDRRFFLLTKTVKDINEKLEQLRTKPNERKLLSQLLLYRNNLSEKVLSKTISNRIQRIVDDTAKKLDNKLQEEAGIKAAAEVSFKKDALEKTEEYFQDENVRNDFTAEALRQFTEGDTAKLDKSKILVQIETDVFKNEYDKNLENARNNFINEQKNKGTLNWVFKNDNERQNEFMSTNEKEQEYQRKLSDWENSHNNVNSPLPAFS